MNTRPTWAEINLTRLRQNYRAIANHVGTGTTVCAVIKCDGYGHGALECALALEAEGASWLGVTNPSEAIVLRKGGVRTRILLLSGFWRGEEETVLKHDLTPAVWEEEHIRSLEAAATRLGDTVRRPVPVHLKVDTGMSRLGIRWDELKDFLPVFDTAPQVAIEGCWSHLATSEVVDLEENAAQTARFNQALDLLQKKGIHPVYRHLANSAAVASRPAAWYDMVRPGLLLYGHCLPLAHTANDLPDAPMTLPLKPVLAWKTHIIDIRRVPAHQAVGYGGTYQTKEMSKLAVIPVGYGDGYSRGMSNRGRVIVRDEYAPVVGNVSMDLTTVDVTHVPGAAIGDEVLLIGASATKSVDVTEVARHCRTVAYEVLCGISKRVPRRYIRNA